MKIFIGYDSRQPIAFTTLAHSIVKRASIPVSIHPLVRSTLDHIYTRPRMATESTEFSFTRFLVPYLCGYANETVLFMDCDMLCTVDIAEILTVIQNDPDRAIWCVQHQYTASSTTKFFNHTQVPYPRKNWSSVMVMNPAKCQILTPLYVNEASAAALHQFMWMPDDLIGALPIEWNWLVGEYPPNPSAKILHYTLGGPWLAPYRNSDHANNWFDDYKEL